MNKIKSALCFLLTFPLGAMAQQLATVAENLKPQPAISYLDSIKSTFVEHKMASCVDSLWIKELTNTDLYADLANDIRSINLDEKVDYDLSTDLLKKRLKEMDAKSPFHIEYNPALENLIKSFLKNRKKAYERLMALSEYYFPLFEESMAKYNVPLEIKYLAIVESALNPKAVSRVGATGLWQFMYQTGKEYNLDIDSYVDERSDPLKASDAAARYMSNMYKIFGDWDLVLASYNSGPGNVAKAIRRSGGQENFWNIRRNLPKETQGYVPAFLATMYIYEYHKEHGIIPQRAPVRQFETDTVGIRKPITFKQLSDLLDMPVAQIQLLNPSYKLSVVPHYKDGVHFLRLPVDKIGIFTSNEDKIYAYVDHEASKRERPYYNYVAQRDSARLAARSSKDTALVAKTSENNGTLDVASTEPRRKYYTVRRGDNLSKIAGKYGVSVSQIKSWNKLKSNYAPLGRKLTIYHFVAQDVAAVERVEKATPVSDHKSTAANTELTVDATEYYTVQKGDNIGSIAKKFNVSVNDIKEWNDLSGNNVMLDAKLRVLKQEVAADEAQKEEPVGSATYTIQKGDNLGIIARKYGVSVVDIQKWNEIEGNDIKVGDKLIILKEGAEKGELAAINKKASEKQTHYLVKKGDSLFTIAKKYPGVTVSDIKKWNGIQGSDLKPGMKLKISG